MSDPNRPYKSHLFNFVNRQSLRIRDRLGETFRHLRVAAEWSVQLLVLPFHWLLHPQQWAGPKLGNGRRQPVLSSRIEYLSDPPVDQPLERVFNSLKPWFELPEDSPILDPLDYQPPQIVLSPQYFEQVRQQLVIGTTPAQLLSPTSPQSEVKNLPSHGLGQLVMNIKNALSFAKQKDLIIQGLACLLENRQLVLTTADNDLLDVLSGSQQQQLQQRMGLELANYGYERRLQWALSQKQIGFISLIDTETQTAIAPLDFLWRKLQWLEHFTFNLQCGASISTAIVPMPTVPLPSLPLRQPLARLDQTVAQIEAKEIQWGQKVFKQLNQGLVSLRETPILEASIEKMSHFQPPLALPQIPQTWQALKSEIVEKLPSSLSPRHSTNLDLPQGQLEATEADPFQIQALIQAAIAYFFSSPSSARPLSAQTSEKLALGKQSGLEETWLSWDDLFSQADDSVAIPGIKPFSALPESDDISAVSLETVNTRIQQKPKLTPTPSKAPQATTYPVPSNLTVSASPSIISDRITDELPDSTITHSPAASLKTPAPKSVPLSKPWEVELETAFDWIETEAKPIGYSKHLLEYILDWLDVIVVILEENLKKLWRWCYQQYLTLNKAN